MAPLLIIFAAKSERVTLYKLSDYERFDAKVKEGMRRKHAPRQYALSPDADDFNVTQHRTLNAFQESGQQDSKCLSAAVVLDADALPEVQESPGCFLPPPPPPRRGRIEKVRRLAPKVFGNRVVAMTPVVESETEQDSDSVWAA